MSSGDEEDVDGGSDEEDEDKEESSREAESGENDSEGDDEDAEEVRQKIKDALKASGVDLGEDDSEEDSDEELMDDEQMMVLDDTLANIFRTRTNDRKSKKGPFTLAWRAFWILKEMPRNRRPTRSNPFQKQSPRSRGHLYQARASKSSQRSTCCAVGRTRDQEQLRRAPTVRQSKRHPQKSTRQIKRVAHDRAAR